MHKVTETHMTPETSYRNVFSLPADFSRAGLMFMAIILFNNCFRVYLKNIAARTNKGHTFYFSYHEFLQFCLEEKD